MWTMKNFNLVFWRSILTALSIMLLAIKAYPSDSLIVDSKIKDVTVFLNGAQINRVAKLKLNAGKHHLVIDKLPSELNPQSIKVVGLKDCKILSVKHQVVYPNQKTKGETQNVLEDEIENQEFKIKEIKNKIGVYNLEEEILLDNSKLQKSRSGTTVSEIKEAADFYRLRLNEIRQKELNLNKELKEANKKIQDLYEKINELTLAERQSFSSISIIMKAESMISGELQLSYYVSSAGWLPSYDFRVEDITNPLDLTYSASVYQSTGEKWDNVQLTLSTSDPSLSGLKPELDPWYLDKPKQVRPRYEYQGGPASTLNGLVSEASSGEPLPFVNISLRQNNSQVSSTTTDFDGHYVIKPVPAGRYDVQLSFVGYETVEMKNIEIPPGRIVFQDFSMNSGVELEEVEIISYNKPLINKDGGSSGGSHSFDRLPTRSASGLAGTVSGVGDSRKSERIKTSNFISNSLKNNVTNLEYKIEVPYTVASDGQDYTIKIKEVSLPVDFVYHAVPKMEYGVFLAAQVVDWEELNLLSGKANIYYQGTYTGETFIDADQSSDTLSVSLGRDRSIIVEREVDKEVFEKRFFGSNIKETIGWNIIVRNNKAAKIRVIVEDQFPMAVRKSIEIDRLEYSDASLEDQSGALTWDIELEPGEKRTLHYKYSVKYPRYMDLQLE